MNLFDIRNLGDGLSLNVEQIAQSWNTGRDSDGASAPATKVRDGFPFNPLHHVEGNHTAEQAPRRSQNVGKHPEIGNAILQADNHDAFGSMRCDEFAHLRSRATLDRKSVV